MKIIKSLVVAAAFAVAVVQGAKAESLAATGGYVPADAPALAFEGVSLDGIGTEYFVGCRMNGGWLTAKNLAASLFVRTEDAESGAVRYQAQCVDGEYAKCVILEFVQGNDGVYAKAVDARYANAASFGTDLSGARSGNIATSDSADGYGIHELCLVAAADIQSISLNFYDGTSKLSGTGDAGAPGYAVPVAAWGQMQGVNGTLVGVTVRGSGNDAARLPSMTATISGTRGTYSWGGYTAASDVRAGYIDENSTYPTPAVTLTNVPFEFYRVVFYASTDNANTRFGYITVNDKNYTSGNSEMDDTQAYETIEGSAAWGKTQVADYIEGVNYLVTPAVPAASDGSVKVVGHKMSNGRGCIAAIQIFKVEPPEIAEMAITATDINTAVPSGESLLRIPAGATITLDAALTASKVRFVSEGGVTLVADSQPSAEELAKLDFTYVKGYVTRSWLTPGVVGFNFNANAGCNGAGAVDGAKDTSLALEIGDWYKDAYSPSGSSTEMFADGLSKLTWTAYNVYAEATNITDGTFIQGYLDDGQNVSITLSAVPYETYDVIIYCSTDNSTMGFKAKTVNGTIYTWDSTKGEVTTTDNVNAAWGLASQAAGKAVYGANTLRINGLSGPLSILGGTNSNNARGCISAIQIMPAGTSTAPTMTVGTAGEATAATWTDSSLWDGGVIPSSGTAKIIVAGDVTLTIDDSVSLSAVTVEGEGSLKLVKGNDATVAFDSLSSQVQILLPDDAISIPTLSAPVRYLYKTATLASSNAGNTYTQGAGTEGAAVAISQVGGKVTLTGGETYYLGDTSSDVATTVTFTDATAVYPTLLSVDMAMYIVEGTSSITTPKIVLSNHGAGRTAIMTLKDSASVTVTSGVAGDTNQGNMFGHWNGPSTFTIQDNATFTCADYEILVGRTGNTQTININGGVFTAKGIMLSANVSTGTNTLNLNGGVLALGELGIGTYGASRTMAVNVLGESEIRATAATLTITQAMTVNAPISFTKADGVEAAVVTPKTISGEGAISVGEGVTLNLATNRPTGVITVDGTLTLALANKTETPVLHVSAQPANIVLYDTDGTTAIEGATVDYDSSAGTITLSSPTAVWTWKVDASFDNASNWSTEVTPGGGANASVKFDQDTEMTVAGTYSLGELAFTGAGDATVEATGTGAITATTYDFSGTTGRVEYKLPTGSGAVVAGADTLLPGGGSGAFTVAAGKSLTLGPWGTTEDGITYNFRNDDAYLTPAANSTLTFSPGEGKVQKTIGYDHFQPSTKVVITNGTYLVNTDGGSQGFFGDNSIVIENGGILSLEDAIDLTGYGRTSSPITINAGGTLQVKMRDTLRRPVEFNGGKITIEGVDQGRALDMFEGNVINVHAQSTIQAVDDGTVANPLIWFRGADTVFNIDDGVSLVNNATYGSFAENNGCTVRGSMNNGNGNGVLVMNGFDGNPLVFTGTATIGESGKPVIYELNCEHQNGTYVVNAGSRLRGSGSVTGNGSVTLAAANSKLCGGLAVDKLIAVNGATYGDQWNAVSASVTNDFEAAGTHTINNGSFTIGSDVTFYKTVVETTTTPGEEEGSETTTTTTNRVVSTGLDRVTFSVAGDGCLAIERDVTLAGLTLADGATLKFAATRGGSAVGLTPSTVSIPSGATVYIVLDFGENSPAGKAFDVLTLPANANLDGVTFKVTDTKGSRDWVASTVTDGNTTRLRCGTVGGFYLIIR